MADVVSQVVSRTKEAKTPTLDKTLQVILGILNCFLFGVGVIIAGILNNDLPDVVIGILQLVIPFVGWVWAVIWGVLMVLRRV
mmetsp:Transcript_5915/g.15128  ORF Transcript_5915/g.15128 Transcript_5915/m.15128 type:complete len:83 (+) Transcript_5915:91-339(+)